MALIGLSKRMALCKICVSFDDDTLNEITLDLILQRRSFSQVREHYSKLLPPEVTVPLSDININNHKKHCDPALIAEDILRRKGEPVTESDIAAKLYAERFQERIDKQKVLHALYQNRIDSLKFLRDLYEEKKKRYFDCKKSTIPTEKSQSIALEKEIKNLIIQIDGLEEDLQQIILKDITIEKGPGHTFINQNFINVFENSLKGFMDDFIPYVLHELFPHDIEKGKEVVAKLSMHMDKHLMPTLDKVNEARRIHQGDRSIN